MVTTAYRSFTDDEVKAGAAEYDRRCEDELTKCDKYPPRDLIAETYQAIEEDNLDEIRFLQTDVALWMKIKEQFADHPTIPQYARYFISLESFQIEEVRRQIENDRQTANEFKILCRRGSDNFIP